MFILIDGEIFQTYSSSRRIVRLLYKYGHCFVNHICLPLKYVCNKFSVYDMLKDFPVLRTSLYLGAAMHFIYLTHCKGLSPQKVTTKAMPCIYCVRPHWIAGIKVHLSFIQRWKMVCDTSAELKDMFVVPSCIHHHSQVGSREKEFLLNEGLWCYATNLCHLFAILSA